MGVAVAIGVFIAFAGFMFDAGVAVVLAGFTFVAGTLVAGVFAGAMVMVFAGVATTTGLLTLALLAGVSPHAIPRALNPRTVESTITFFILIKDSYLSQSINFLFPGVRLIEHNRFAPNSFLFKANVNIVIREIIVNLKSTKTVIFKYFFSAILTGRPELAAEPMFIGVEIKS